MTKNKIPLPCGGVVERQFENALLMDIRYRERYEELLMDNTREAMVLIFVLTHMDKCGKLTTNFTSLTKSLHCSRLTINNAIAFLQEKYEDLVSIKRKHGAIDFSVDTNRCFKA